MAHVQRGEESYTRKEVMRLYIMSENGKQIINTEFVERFCIVEKEDAALVVASYSDVRAPVTIGKYLDAAEAKGVLADIMAALSGVQCYYNMPGSRLFAGEYIKKDARIKRRGGS